MNTCKVIKLKISSYTHTGHGPPKLAEVYLRGLQILNIAQFM